MLARAAKLYQTVPTLLVFALPATDKGEPVAGIFNFLTKEFATCSIAALHWLSYFNKGKILEDARGSRLDLSADAVDAQVEALLSLGFLTELGTQEHSKYVNYSENWEWDALAGAFHFSALNNEFMTLDQSTSSQIQKLATVQQPELFWVPSQDGALKLPSLSNSAAQDHLNLLAKRRTNRTSAHHILELQELGDCLFSAFGICGHVQTASGRLPLSLAPSGGARNPYEPYVIVRRCNGLESGIYHYSAYTHELDLVGRLPIDFSAAQLLANQDWAEEMAAVVIMVAVLERTMWKYQDSNAYRVLLIEAGHRAQNFMTTATQLGLTACPTAALAHEQIQSLLNLSNTLLHAPVYAVTLDKSQSNTDEFHPNPIYASTFANQTPELAQRFSESIEQPIPR
jgi:SagB-type dehydrogenase family enzyme